MFEIINDFYYQEFCCNGNYQIEKDLTFLDDDNELKLCLQSFQQYRNNLFNAETENIGTN